MPACSHWVSSVQGIGGGLLDGKKPLTDGRKLQANVDNKKTQQKLNAVRLDIHEIT